MKLIKYHSSLQTYFESLNRAWIEKYFTMEAPDEAMLLHPDENIIQKGGQIFFCEYENQIIGTVALIYVNRGVLEMAKMAVDERFQGLGAGKFLCKSAINEAKKMNADKIILVTNSQLKTAIAIYHKFGFKEIPVIENEYQRADTKMELLLTPLQPKWFDRRFYFKNKMEEYERLLSKLNHHQTIIKSKVKNLNDDLLNYQPVGKWSIKEHIGHLRILESLWQLRFLELKQNNHEMSPADLNNSATDSANFNQYSIEQLLNYFEKERVKTIQLLNSFQGNDFTHTLFHPRLQQPMRIIDLMYFVSEHDLHHIDTITTIIQNNSEDLIK